jgi:hypothetical protein
MNVFKCLITVKLMDGKAAGEKFSFHSSRILLPKMGRKLATLCKDYCKCVMGMIRMKLDVWRVEGENFLLIS